MVDPRQNDPVALARKRAYNRGYQDGFYGYPPKEARFTDQDVLAGYRKGFASGTARRERSST